MRLHRHSRHCGKNHWAKGYMNDSFLGDIATNTSVRYV
jgi:hypothetical protein